MKFRNAKKEDIPHMFTIIQKNWPKYPKTLARKELEEMFSTALIKPTYIVAEEHKEIVAFAGFSPSWRDNLIFNMFWINVHPEHKGKEIGSKLITAVIDNIQNIKNPQAKLILISTEMPSFYKKFGFRKKGPAYDKKYVVMSLRLR